MTAQDIREFNAYLEACTDQQVLGVLDKERAARRHDYVALAEREVISRGLEDE